MNNILSSIAHGVAVTVMFAVPLILASHSPVLDMTVGGALTALYTHFVIKA